MLAPSEIRAHALRKYPDFLRSLIDGTPFFPLSIRFGKPSSTADFVRLKRDIEALAQQGTGYRIDWREVRSRRVGLGRQKFPDKVWFESEADYLVAIGKTAEAARFRDQIAQATTSCSEIITWMRQRPLAAVECQTVWPELLLVCSWLNANPRPGCYPRELPLPIGTKFVDEHQSVLREMLAVVLPSESIRAESQDFALRFGFKRDEPLIRLRVLDRSAVPAGWPPVITEFCVPHPEFLQLGWPARRVLIVENKFTFLSLPPLPDCVAIWGAGGAVELITTAPWLNERQLFYWGDLDVAGFQLLGRLRQAFRSVQSLMMDADTLSAYQSLAIACKASPLAASDGLTDAELAVCETLRHRELRLEQEKLPHQWVIARLQSALCDV